MFDRDHIEKRILLEQTQKKYFELYSEEISDEDSYDIIRSLREYSEILIEIYEENKELFHSKTGIPVEKVDSEKIDRKILETQPEN